MTGAGCALGALVAAFLGGAAGPAAGRDRAAHAVLAVAAERASSAARGPGSFAVGLLDELSGWRRIAGLTGGHARRARRRIL